MIALAVFVGVGTGLGAVAFRKLIALFKTLFFTHTRSLFGFLGSFSVVPLPAIGGILVGLLVYFFAREAKGHGVPEVMAAVALKGGRIRPIVVLIKCLASSICIGSGGSAGREGPIVQIGSAFGSTVGQVLKLSDRRIRTLVAAGAGSGIAATFNTPIAGVIFAMEVILGEFATETFSAVVIASVIATVAGRAFLGNQPAFAAPTYTLTSVWEILLYAGLGVACAVVATAFIRGLYRSERIFERLRMPEWGKPALGGLGVGVLGVYAPQVFGVGYESIDAALTGQVTLVMLAVLVVAKIAATSLTLGSGGSGGVFAPSLFMGAMLGGLYGRLAHGWWPSVTAPTGAYALVGMAGLFSASARAPITSVIILFEMTQDYAIMLPLMLTCAVSTLLGTLLSRESIYTIKLKSRGIDLLKRRDLGVVQGITVGQAMRPVEQLTTISPEMSVQSLARLFSETYHHGFAVLDASGAFFGVVTLKDLERTLHTEQSGERTVRDIATTNVVTAFPDETLEDVLRAFGALDVGRIPVVDRKSPKKLLGMLRWSDIVRSYSQVMLDLEYEPGTGLIQCDIHPGDRAVGRTLGELSLPADCAINYIQRGKHIVVPGGDTRLEPGDRLFVLLAEGRDKDLCRVLYNYADEKGAEGRVRPSSAGLARRTGAPPGPVPESGD